MLTAIITLLISAAAISLVSGLPEMNVTCGEKVYKYTPLGCFKDRPYDKALPNELINYRDTTSPMYAKQSINWNKWDTFLEEMFCECVKRSGHNTYVGLQNYGECWSSPVTAKYDRFGWSSRCVTTGFEVCDYSKPICVGKANRNYVYKIHPL